MTHHLRLHFVIEFFSIPRAKGAQHQNLLKEFELNSGRLKLLQNGLNEFISIGDRMRPD